MTPRSRIWIAVALAVATAVTVFGVALAVIGQTLWGWAIGSAGVVVVFTTASLLRGARSLGVAEADDGSGTLLQQRMRLDRSRTVGVLFLGYGVAAFVVGLLQVMSPPDRPFDGAALITGGTFAALGIVQVVGTSRRRKRFEQEHGKAAGKQRAVGR